MTHPEPVAASVIIPVYNGANYITQQLDALAAQTGNPSFEVLICDNGSTDSTSVAEPATPAIWGRYKPQVMSLSSAMVMIL